MEDEDHYAQDALEHYAVALMQREAETRGVATTHDSDEKLRAFIDYGAKHGMSFEWFRTGPLAVYMASYDRHLPDFVGRLAATFPGETFDFIAVEAEYRNLGLKGDFVIRMSPSDVEMSVSLKNYRKDSRRPQSNAQTFNSFVLGMLFEGTLGMYVDPTTGETFRGADFTARDAALERNGYLEIVPAMHELDDLNRGIKADFVYSDQFAVLDREGEAVFNTARKRVGDAGATIVMGVLAKVSKHQIKARLLKMIGLDGAEETLLMDPTRSTDTITKPKFRTLRDLVQVSTVEIVRTGQSIQFVFVAEGTPVLAVNVPFTINKNGAWMSRRTPAEGALKDGVILLPGARRQKAKEMATSINTYSNFSKTGIFD